MTIDQLKYLIMLNHCQSITQAAEILHISHQALSSSIKSLEKELNTSLIVSTNRGSRLTPKGAALVEISSNFVHALDELFPADDLKSTFSPIIAVSYVSLTNYLANKIRLLHSKIDLEPVFLEFTTNEDIINAVLAQQAELGFCAIFYTKEQKNSSINNFAILDKNFSYHTVTTLNIYCELASDHPLAHLAKIPLSKLAKYQLKYFYPKITSQEIANSKLLDHSLYHFSKFFSSFNYTIENNPMLYRQAVDDNHCIGLAIAENEYSHYGLKRIPLAEDCGFLIIALRQQKEQYHPLEQALYY